MATYKIQLSLKQEKKEVCKELSTMHTTFTTLILSIAEFKYIYYELESRKHIYIKINAYEELQSVLIQLRDVQGSITYCILSILYLRLYEGDFF